MPRRKVDLMGFPIPQHLVMRKDPTMSLHSITAAATDVMHITVCPPRPDTTLSSIREEQRWLEGRLNIGRMARMIGSGEPPIHPSGGPVLIGGLQHPPVDWSPDGLFALSKAGVRISTLAYQSENQFGGGFQSDAGLTDEGREYIKELCRTKMVLDLAHANERTALDALTFLDTAYDLDTARVCITHTGCRGIYDHERNASDEVLQRVSELGGIAGIMTTTFFLHESDNSLEPFLRHVERALEMMGDDSVAIGSDGVYQHIDAEGSFDLFKTMQAKFDPTGRLRARWPDQPAELNGPDLLLRLFQPLADEFGVDIADKILGENAFRFLEDSL